MTHSWFKDANGVPASQAAAELGAPFAVRAGRLWPCPACGEERRSSKDGTKGPVKVGDGWRCYRCSAAGTTVDLVARVLLDTDKPSPSDWPTVRAWFAARGWCDPDREAPGTHAPVRRAPRRPAPAPEPPRRNPLAEVQALWGSAEPVFTAPHTLRWCHARRFGDGWRIAALDLARALGRDSPRPRWARCRRESWWGGGWRMVMPLYDHLGELRGLRARWTGTAWEDDGWQETPAPDGRKSVCAAGAQAAGLVMADPIGLWLLRGREGLPDPSAQGLRWDGRLWLLEGETDLFTWATRKARIKPRPDGATVDACLAYTEGAWTPDIAARVPASARVTLVPDIDADGKGLAMADKIADTLRSRVASVAVLRLDQIDQKGASNGH